MSRSVIVLGMARTGTSAVTRILNLLGVELGPDDGLLGPIQHVNAKGFFEHYEIMRLNTEILRRHGGSWRAIPELRAGWEDDPALDDLRERAAEIVGRDFDGAPLWGFKDPRTCLTLPFWRPLLEEPAFVICHRNVLDIAESLRKRDKLEEPDSVNLWKRYLASAIAQTRGERRIFVGYDELFAPRIPVLGALAEFLHAPERPPDRSVRAKVRRWLDPELRHHDHPLDEVLSHAAVDADARELHLLLELAVRERAGEPALAGAGGTGPLSRALDALAGRLLESLAVSSPGAATRLAPT